MKANAAANKEVKQTVSEYVLIALEVLFITPNVVLGGTLRAEI